MKALGLLACPFTNYHLPTKKARGMFPNCSRKILCYRSRLYHMWIVNWVDSRTLFAKVIHHGKKFDIQRCWQKLYQNLLVVASDLGAIDYDNGIWQPISVIKSNNKNKTNSESTLAQTKRFNQTLSKLGRSSSRYIVFSQYVFFWRN